MSTDLSKEFDSIQNPKHYTENRQYEPVKVKMVAPGSAQVTRVRLIETYEGLDVYTKGSYIHIGLA